MIVNLQQNTPEWLEFRKGKITASMMPIIMGDSPYETPFGLWQRIHGLKPEPEVTPAMQRGLDLEPIALQKLNSLINTNMKPAVILSQEEECEWAMCSLDGAQFYKCGIITYAAEIKCPNAEDHELAKQGKIPKKYKAQVQWQLFVTGLQMLYYFSFDGEKGVILEVHRDEEYMKKLFVAAQEFKTCVDQFIPPEMTEKEKRQADIKEMKSEAWKIALDGFYQSKKSMEDHEKDMNEWKQNLIELSGGSDARGAGYKLSKIVTKGRLDYDKILCHHKIDIDLCQEFRKPHTESWRITKDD